MMESSAAPTKNKRAHLASLEHGGGIVQIDRLVVLEDDVEHSHQPGRVCAHDNLALGAVAQPQEE